jgi:hypothetical protein
VFDVFLRKPFEKILFCSRDIQILLRALSLKKYIFCNFSCHPYLIKDTYIGPEIFTVSTSYVQVLLLKKLAQNNQLLMS